LARARLSRSDVDRLLQDRSAGARIETMVKLVQELESEALTDPERDLALELLHAFSTDIEVQVREAVAWQVYNSPVLTAELAEQLARDVARVGVPILRNVEALPESLLLQIIAERDPQKQLAIAGRNRLTEKVSSALIETSNVVTIVHLLRNRGAEISPAGLHRALDRHGAATAVGNAMAARPALPMTVVERLIAFVSEDIQETLVKTHGVEKSLARRLARRGREAATQRLLAPLIQFPGGVEMMVRHLNRDGRLTVPFLFRALCAGDLELFVAGLAEKADVTLSSAQLLVWDAGSFGLRCLLDAAGVPDSCFGAFRAVVETAQDTGYVRGEIDQTAFQAEAACRLFDECGAVEERELDELLMQACDTPGARGQADLLPVRL
jgi:uncharacterized protein (DUF2336 family)